MHRRILLTLALLLPLARLAPAEPPSHESRIASLRQDLETALSHFQQNLTKPDAKLDSRELTFAAHDLLALGHPASEAEPLIQKAFDAQNMDPLSPAFGTFPWQINNPDIHDPNAVEFTIKPLAPIFLLYGDKLSPQFKHDAIRHLHAAAQGILHHKVGIDYTNIFLMKCANLYSLGLILKDRDLELGGIKGFREWFTYTRAHGIAEYNSPTYANTQLSCLLQTYRTTTSPTLKKELAAALDYMWTDLAANTFLNKNTLGSAQLAGPFSRTYDFISGIGPFDRFLYAEGLRDAPPSGTIFVDIADPVLNELENGYRPDPTILNIARMPSRTLHQTFGPNPGGGGQDRTTFLTQNFAIGSASAEHGQQDRQLSVSLAELTPGKTICDVSVISETLDAPYGNKKLPDRAGHQKPTHLKTAAATVQDNGTILALLDLAPSLNADLLKNPTPTLDTSIIFPANADTLFLDGKPLSLTPNQSLPITATSWLIIREGNAAAAMRIFLADPVGGGGDSDRFYIKYDCPDSRAARLVAYHLNQSKPLAIPDTPIRAGILLLVRDCPTPEFPISWNSELHAAALTQSTNDPLWTATFTDNARQLTATLNLQTHLPTRRTINNIEVQSPTFTLNGEDKTALLPSTP